MKKYINKKYIVLLIFIVLVSLFSTISFCNFSTNEIIQGMNPKTSTGGDPTTGSRLLGIISQVFTVVQFIGTGISIIMVMKLGITYMISSIEEKAEIKKSAAPIVIGSVLIVATVNILKIISDVVENSFK